MGGADASSRGAQMLVADNKVCEGLNGRLFLDNDQNRVLYQHAGELLFTNRELDEWRFLLETRVAWLSVRGVPYFFLVPPNAHSVYPEDLPEQVPRGAMRPVPQLLNHLAERESFAHLEYPRDAIVAAKPALLYPKTDPHWTARGAFIGYRVLADQIAELMPIHKVPAEDVVYREKSIVGELGFKMNPKRESLDLEASVPRPRAVLVMDNQVFNTGSLIETSCPEAPPTTCLLFGDSFVRKMLPFFAASFRRLVFAQVVTLDHTLVEEVRPDVVVTVVNERFMIQIHHDAGAATLQDIASEKLEAGRLRERMFEWEFVPAGG